MRRREFISLLGGAAVWPLAARAQQPAMPVVGVLDSVGANAVAAFRDGLNEVGYVEGRNVAIELRATDRYDRLSELATELLLHKVAVIAAIGGPSAHATKAAAASIPIVFSVGGDPIELGLVSSINRPEANITGVTFFSKQLLQKQVGILHEFVPKVSVLGVLINPKNPRHRADSGEVQAAARTLGLDVHIANAASERDLIDAFTSLVQHHAKALIIAGDPFFLRNITKLVALAEQHSVAAVFASRDFAVAGGLMSYGASLPDAYRQAGIYVGRILKGEKPGNLPIIQPSKFELVLNLKTAKALGLMVPDKLLALADEVIE
jgi:putative tryptophan/tyrosine transport system substrate-binding protein